MSQQNAHKDQPLATRMRPQTLSEVVGQDHLTHEGAILNRMVKTGQVTSIILYGPPGIGKTSIAHALSNDLNRPFSYFNAGVHTKKDLQQDTKEATPEEPVLVLIDEIHRLDKPKQDFLLMHIEDGSLIVVGATTENPYINISPALRSRSHVFELETPTDRDIKLKLCEALNKPERGLGDYQETVSDDHLAYIAGRSNGDIRVALNTLELAVMSTEPDENGRRHINQDVIETCLHERDIGGDKDGDMHYNLLSALQKSIRGSDADASLHYLARLIKNGDLISINRRLLVIAYEDIGLADTSIWQEALTAIQSAEKLGLPEARIPLADMTVRLALSPKSNEAYQALDRASAALNSEKSLDIPNHLQDTHYKGAKDLNKGGGYRYPHHFAYHIVEQTYLPEAFQTESYLRFNPHNNIPGIQKRFEQINQLLYDKNR